MGAGMGSVTRFWTERLALQDSCGWFTFCLGSLQCIGIAVFCHSLSVLSGFNIILRKAGSQTYFFSLTDSCHYLMPTWSVTLARYRTGALKSYPFY